LANYVWITLYRSDDNALIARTNVKLLALSYTLFRLDHGETSGITKILYVS